MRRWGLIITLFYATVLVALLAPLFFYLSLEHNLELILRDWVDMTPVWVPYASLLIAAQALLLGLSVDSSWRRLRPRRHVLLTAGLAGLLSALLLLALGWSLAVAMWSDDAIPDDAQIATLIWLALWACWAAVFYWYLVNEKGGFSDIVSWLIKGSVLELLVAVPCHVIVRHRDDCSAPGITSFGIVTGLAIMLMAFGPGVLALYTRRLRQYPSQQSSE